MSGATTHLATHVSTHPTSRLDFFVHRCGVGVRKSRAEEEDDTGVESEYALKEAPATEFYALQLCVHDR